MINGIVNADIVILTCVWGRYSLTHLYLEYLRWLIDELKSKITIKVLIVGSGELDIIREVERNGFEYLDCPNNPLSAKWQAGIDLLVNWRYKALLILGSDDFIDTNLVNYYIDFLRLDNYYACGFRNCYFLDLNEKKWMYWAGYGVEHSDMQPHRLGEPIGSGRLIRREALDLINHDLWRGMFINKGLDFKAYESINKITSSNSIITGQRRLWEINNLEDVNGMMVDVKVGHSITKFTSIIKDKNFNFPLEYKIYEIMRSRYPPFLVSKLLDIRSSLSPINLDASDGM